MRVRWRTVFYRPANAMTALAVLSGLATAFLAIAGRPAEAAIALVAAGVFDLLDGPLARAFPGTPDQRTFGARFDSLADACNFGFAPTVFAFAALGLTGPLEVTFLGLYAICALGRLAAFDTFGLEEDPDADQRHYRGVPSTFAALFIPIVYCARDHLTAEAFAWTYTVLYPVLGLAMISRLRIKKPGRTGIVLLLALAVVAVGHLVHMALGGP